MKKLINIIFMSIFFNLILSAYSQNFEFILTMNQPLTVSIRERLLREFSAQILKSVFSSSEQKILLAVGGAHLQNSWILQVSGRDFEDAQKKITGFCKNTLEKERNAGLK